MPLDRYSATGGIGWRPLKTETLTASATQFAFNVEGVNADEYMIEFNLVLAGGAATQELTFRPNGLTTGQQSHLLFVDNAAVPANMGGTQTLFFTHRNTVRFPVQVSGSLLFGATTGTRRFFQSDTIDTDAGGLMMSCLGRGFWTDTSTAVTSLVLNASQSMLTGSTFTVSAGFRR